MIDRFGPGSDSREPIRETAVADVRTSVFQSNIPTYILNKDFWFDDWNSAFELIFGDVPGLRRGEHVSVWARALANYAAVKEHGERVFRNAPPPVDTEPIEFQSTRFGRFVFKKIATSALGGDAGATVGWVSVLNVDSVEKADEYYLELSDRMAAQLSWTKYAMCYDSVLQEFKPYQELAQAHIDAIGAGQRVLDLGAGTGYLTKQLLKKRKQVRAVDFNDAMLQRLRTACNGYPGLTVMKADLESLQGLPPEEYDGVVMMNALSWLPSPLSCLRKAWSALRRGGVIAFSCPSDGSTLDALFGAIQADLVKRNRFERLRREFDQVRERNEEMERRGWLRKFTLDQVEQLLTNAGFARVLKAEAGVYAGQGLFVVAQK
jgi:ubiquinone/menaquinone biosynthesis C-methylase UbiE